MKDEPFAYGRVYDRAALTNGVRQKTTPIGKVYRVSAGRAEQTASRALHLV